VFSSTYCPEKESVDALSTPHIDIADPTVVVEIRIFSPPPTPPISMEVNTYNAACKHSLYPVIQLLCMRLMYAMAHESMYLELNVHVDKPPNGQGKPV
jgi:hypothetical protein